MKALLVETQDLKRRAIILLPSGKIELGIGDPANIVIESSDKNNEILVRVLVPSDSIFKVIKEVDVNDILLLEAAKYMEADASHQRALISLRDCLFNEMVDPKCEAMSYLDFGSLLL